MGALSSRPPVKAGTLNSLPALLTGLLLVIALLGVKMLAKFVGIWPLSRAFQLSKREGNYTTLLMSTSLTFGSISALYGLTHGIINQAQYTILVSVVIGSAIVPTFIAQTWFLPKQPKLISSQDEKDLLEETEEVTSELG
jgi:Kef-type K+ transport system membrane component KefB